MRFFFCLILLPMFAGADQRTLAYNIVDPAPGPWDRKVEQFLGERYEIQHFRAANHQYKEPVVTSGEAPTPLFVMEEGQPVQAFGIVHVYFVIEADGTVQTAIPDRQDGCECLEKYLADSVKAFTFRPARIDGEAVATTALQVYDFSKPES